MSDWICEKALLSRLRYLSKVRFESNGGSTDSKPLLKRRNSCRFEKSAKMSGGSDVRPGFPVITIDVSCGHRMPIFRSPKPRKELKLRAMLAQVRVTESELQEHDPAAPTN